MIAGLRTKNSRSKFPPSSTCFLGLSTNPYSLKVFWGKYLDFNLLGWWIFCWATLQLYIWWLVQTCKKSSHSFAKIFFPINLHCALCTPIVIYVCIQSIPSTAKFPAFITALRHPPFIYIAYAPSLPSSMISLSLSEISLFDLWPWGHQSN